MRLLKENTAAFAPLTDSLKDLSLTWDQMDQRVDFFSLSDNSISSHKLVEKYSHIIQNITSFENQVSNAQSITDISSILKLSLKRTLPVKESNIFFFDDNMSKLLPFDNDEKGELVNLVNKINETGVMDWVFETRKATFLPEMNHYTAAGSRLNYILHPIYENKHRQGVLAILTTIPKKQYQYLDDQVIQIILRLSLARIEKIRLKEKLNTTYSELQTYQGKLEKDFRLSAIGELTDGVLDEIISPLQVIMSYIDMLNTDVEASEKEVIKSQVFKIRKVIDRLVKFASLNYEQSTVYPCDLNAAIEEYYEVLRTSLEQYNIECVLELEKNLPPVLSHSNHLYQIISNVLQVVRTLSQGNGGVIIQTRYCNETILLKFTATVQLSKEVNGTKKIKDEATLSVNIIKNLMKKHDGEMKLEASRSGGSSITLSFPLKRKIKR